MLLAWIVTILIAAMIVAHFQQRINHLQGELRRLFWRLDRLEQGAQTQDVPASHPEKQTPQSADKYTKETEAQPEKAAISPPVATATHGPKCPQPNRLSRLAVTFEHELSTRWVVWAGGAISALGGAFLVKYSIDTGLLSPSVRVILASILGLVMIAGGEILRRRQGLAVVQKPATYIPSAIGAAGVFTVFAAIYAAFALYGLLPPIIAFILLALISVLASLLALGHGRFFAALGVVGALVVPALIPSEDSSAWILFPYLLAVVSANLWIARLRAWLEIALPTLILAALWALVWMLAGWTNGDVIPLGGYLILLTIFAGFMASGASPARGSDTRFKGLLPTHPITALWDIFTVISTIFIVAAVRLDLYSSASLATIAAFGAVQAYAVWRTGDYDAAGLCATVGFIFLLATWHMPYVSPVYMGSASGVDDMAANLGGYVAPAVVAPDIASFVITALLIGVGPSVGLFSGLNKLLRPALWASVSAALPVVVLIITYARIADFQPSLPFASIALLLALWCTAAASRMRPFTQGGNPAPMAAYAAGATLSLALTLAMTLQNAWLSFALALELAALGYIWRATRVWGLRLLALSLATAVLVRLFLNASIFGYHGDDGPMPIINWLFYGYGLTAGLFYLAGRLFDKGEQADHLMAVMKAGTAILAVSFITLELRVLFSEGQNLTSTPTALEAALQTTNWSFASLVLLWRHLKDQSQPLLMVSRAMTVISICGLLVGGAFVNAYWHRDIDGIVIFNVQTLQFLLPALILAAKGWLLQHHEQPKSGRKYWLLAFGLLWFWLGAEVEFWFTLPGTVLAEGWKGYLYSLVWLIYACGLIFAGLKLHRYHLRMAGFLVLATTVLKVFIVDMSNLDGLARALSFLGLGAALIGTGMLYQRLKRDDIWEDAQI